MPAPGVSRRGGILRAAPLPRPGGLRGTGCRPRRCQEAPRRHPGATRIGRGHHCRCRVGARPLAALGGDARASVPHLRAPLLGLVWLRCRIDPPPGLGDLLVDRRHRAPRPAPHPSQEWKAAPVERSLARARWRNPSRRPLLPPRRSRRPPPQSPGSPTAPRGLTGVHVRSLMRSLSSTPNRPRRGYRGRSPAPLADSRPRPEPSGPPPGKAPARRYPGCRPTR